MLREKLVQATSNANQAQDAGACDAMSNLPPIFSVVPSNQRPLPVIHHPLNPFPFHSMVPRNDMFDCLSDEILVNFLKICRLDTKAPLLPDLTTLLDPETDCAPKTGSVQSLDKILIDLAQRLPSFPSLPEQIANHYVLYEMSVVSLSEGQCA